MESQELPESAIDAGQRFTRGMNNFPPFRFTSKWECGQDGWVMVLTEMDMARLSEASVHILVSIAKAFDFRLHRTITSLQARDNAVFHAEYAFRFDPSAAEKESQDYWGPNGANKS